jgi:protein ImuA
MSAVHPDIIQQLRQEILLREGLRPPSAAAVDMGLGAVAAAFPQGVFPTGAMHELLSDGPEGAAAGSAWVAALIGRLMTGEGACVWIGPRRITYPPALKAYGLEPDRVVFVDVRREKEALWALEEALKCEGLAAVVGEISEVSFLASRRFQLAVEQSRVTGFLLRDRPRNRQPIATVARWQITPLPGGRDEAIPGVGFPKWSVELLRMRGGQPGRWELEWREGRFHSIMSFDSAAAQPGWKEEPQRKTG